MFDKKKCKNCRSKISDKYDFCPYCGMRADSQENFGMLGKNDFVNESDNFSKSFFGGFGGNILDKMLGNAMRMLEKEMRREMKNQELQPKPNFQLFINGKKVNLDGSAVNAQKKEPRKVSSVKLPQNKLKNFAKLPKKNPKTEIRRFSNRIVYEIEVPGVKAMNDISIAKLENSIEIKAVSKDHAYLKVIPINLPIMNYGFENQKIILELEAGG